MLLRVLMGPRFHEHIGRIRKT